MEKRGTANMELIEILKFISEGIEGEVKRQNISQKEIAIAIGVKPPSITHYKSYGNRPETVRKVEFFTAYKILRYLLGRPPIILDPPAIDDLTARRVQAILSGPRADLFKLFLEVLHAGELLKPEEISKVEAYIDMLQTVLRARKSPEPAAPGADCTPSSAA